MNFDFSKLNNLQGEVKTTMPTQSTTVEEVVIKKKPIVEEKNTTNVVINKKVEVKEDEPINSLELSEEILNLNETEINKRVESIVNNINSIKSELNSKFIERTEEINMLILGLVSATNSFLHGPAGTGKSNLTEELANRITNSNYFRILMGKTTEPAEVFGPVSLNAMKEDVYKVNTKGKLPQANIAFLDEVFKANSAVLNSLLTIMNEKLFFNDTVEEVPTISVIGASNEYIEEDSLIALYDRFLLRWHVDYIQDPSNRIALFNNFLSSRKNGSKLSKLALVAATSNDTTIELEDLLILNESCKEIDFPTKVLKEYNSLFVKLEKKGILVSDRRKNEAIKVLQASALLNGRKTITPKDFDALKYILWNNQEDILVVVDEINKIADPNKIKYDGYVRSMAQYKKDLADLEANKEDAEYTLNRSLKITEINKSLQFGINSINKIIKSLGDDKEEVAKFESLQSEMKSFIEELKEQIFS